MSDTDKQQQQVATTAEQEEPILIVDQGMVDFKAAGWSNQLEQLRAETKALKKCALRMHPTIRADDAIASPEAMDPKTDLLLNPIQPPSEYIKKGLMKKGTELSETEAVDAADTLLSFFSMFARGTQSNISLETCFYVHVREYAAGSIFEPILEAISKSMVHIIHIIDASQVRDGDEEFSPSYFSTKLGASVARNSDISNEAFVALDAEAKKGTALGKRCALLAAFARFTAVAVNLGKTGAKALAKPLGAAADALAATVDAVKGARDGAPQPPDACFTGVGSVWDTVTIPHVAVAPCAWSDATGFFTTVAADAKMIIAEWLPLQNDLVATLSSVQRYCYSEPAPPLMARSVAAGFVIGGGMHPFGGETLLQSVGDMMTKKYGAPWYAAVARAKTENEIAMTNEIVNFAVKSAPESQRGSEKDIKRSMMVGSTTTLLDVGRLILTLINAYLRNRGRCHRHLTNLLSQIAQVQQQVWQAERSMFLGNPAGAFAKANASAVGRNEVLLALVTDLMCDTCFNILRLSQSLDLLTQPELLPVMAYHVHFGSARLDMVSTLYPTSRHITEFDEVAKRRGAPAVIGMRRAVAAPKGLLPRIEASMYLTRGLMTAMTVIKAKIPQLAMPEPSLQSMETIFNTRFMTMIVTQQRPPLMQYSDIQEMNRFTDGTKAITTAVDIFKSTRARIAHHKESGALPEDDQGETLRLLDAIDKAAHKNAVAAGVVHKMPGFKAKLELDAEFPFVITLVTEKVEA